MPDSLADRLFFLRRRKRFYQKQMADLLGIELRTYRSYENGKRTPGKLAMIELERRIALAEMGV